MSKGKLAKFADMASYPHVFECPFKVNVHSDFPLRGHWRSGFFHNDNPIVLELGCGRGEYTVGLARRYPERNFIGVDIKGARMWSGATESLKEGLTNVAFLRTNIEIIDRFFAPGEVQEIWLTFSDPQMKKATKRLTSTYFLCRYRRFLTDGGLIHLKTDSNFLFTYTKYVCEVNQLPVEVCTEDLYGNSQFIIHNSQFIIHNEADAQTIEPETIMNFELCIMNSVRSLLSLFTDHILNPATHHLDLFFAMDWTRMSTAESYGHDIECSWLMHEAAMVLADARVIKEVEPVVREVATASEKGLLSSGAMIHESGDADLHWWVQAEAVVGFFNLYQHFGDEAALTKALGVWSFIQEHLIDYENGEWYWSVREDGRVNLDDDHAGFWKCPYHNGRMCLELIERIGSMLVS